MRASTIGALRSDWGGTFKIQAGATDGVTRVPPRDIRQSRNSGLVLVLIHVSMTGKYSPLTSRVT